MQLPGSLTGKQVVARCYTVDHNLLRGTNLTESCNNLGFYKVCLSCSIQAWRCTDLIWGYNATTDWSITQASLIALCEQWYWHVVSNARRLTIYYMVVNPRRFLTHPWWNAPSRFILSTSLLHEMVCKMSSLTLVCLHWHVENVVVSRMVQL